MKKTMLLVSALLITAASQAEVTDAAANGFTTVNEVVIADGRAEVWVAAMAIGHWWSSDHTVSGDAARMSIEPVTQGCFCESLGEEAGVVHLVVTMVNPTHLIRMTGGLGPLGLMGVDGNMTWEFEDDEEGTRVRFTYAVGGYSANGLDEIAPAVDFVIGAALGRLKNHVETGKPESATVE